MAQEMTRLLWLDLEMTGLSEVKDKILEVAALVTDLEFNPLGSFHRVVKQPPEILAAMDEWCTRTHKKSGLTEDVGRIGVPLPEVEDELVAFCLPLFAKGERIVIAGNSIHQDRKFIEKHMPNFDKILHYRMLDVSAFKVIFKAKWNIAYEKKNRHRAVDDIHESIAELKLYLGHIKVSP